ncbi:MAG: hypothetical protein GQ570_02675 [Helicobacteraceae bacterium]|nr:hypothetical protein [Helicobacteraceae bacterium]
MFKYYKHNDQKRAMNVVFEYEKDKTIGVSAYFVKGSEQVEKRRIEKLIYKKED